MTESSKVLRLGDAKVAVAGDETDGKWTPKTIIPGGAAVEAGTLSITLGGTRQQVFAANTSRRSLTFSNTSDTVMYVRFGANAGDGVGIYCAPAGGGFVLEGSACPTNSVDVICAATGKKFYAVEI